MKTRTCKLQRELDTLAAAYDREATKALERARQKYVIPFCDKHSLKFVTGMGSWSFWKNGDLWKGDDVTWSSDEGLPKRLVEVLRAEMHTSRNDAGSLMDDYTSPTYCSSRVL